MREKAYRHIQFKRDRFLVPDPTEHTSNILKSLAQDEKSSENLSRARRTVRDLILCNNFEYFCTFTFSDEKVDRYDFKACRKKLTTFFMNYRNRYSDSFRYIIIPEFHKDGAIHFHGMVRGIRLEDFEVPEFIEKRNVRTGELTLVPNTKGYIRWKQYNLGFFSCSKVLHYEGCATYVSKYITKDLMKLPLGQRVFMASENLRRPELIFDEDDIPLVDYPDYFNEFVYIKDTDTTYGLIDEFWMEGGDKNYDDEIASVIRKRQTAS